MMPAMNDEYVVLLDELGKPIGQQLKTTVHHADTPLHSAFSIFLFDGQGRSLFQRRALHKPTWPGVWSNACCGHPAPGEPLASAAQRRLSEELGITQSLDLELMLPHFRYRAQWDTIWENEICPVFVGHYDGPVKPNPQEVAATFWIDWEVFAFCRGDGPSIFNADFSPWCRWEATALLELPQFKPIALPIAC